MRQRRNERDLDDADARAVRHASRVVGAQITLAFTLVVLAVLIAAFVFVFHHISPTRLFDPGRHEETIDVGGIDIITAGVIIGIGAIILAGTVSWFATRRAVRPLGDALRIQRAFVADASHELRTPLAVLDARLQQLQRGLQHDDPSAPTVAELRRDSHTLIEIVNDLLASAEVGGDASARHPVTVNPIVALAVDSMRIIAGEKQVGVTVNETRPLATMMPAAAVHRCLVALLDNALDFAPVGSIIHVSLSESRSMVRISVRDEGPGITGIDPARIFDRFARSSDTVDGGGSSRTGFGIGLSLVRDTVERAGGTASVASTSAQGTEIELRVPLTRQG
ncbi:MAG: HAMP domain-containing sensor histidine kinase [Actinomycetota bacterium]